jgi:hypothetical protein
MAVLKGVGATGKPELAKEAAALIEEPLPPFIPAASALAELANGHEAAAVKLANEQAAPGAAAWILSVIADQYREQRRDLDALRIDRLLLERLRSEGPKDWFENAARWYVDRSTQAGQYRQALEWWPHLAEKDRSGSLGSILFALRQPEDIAAATKVVAGLSGGARRDAEKALAWARSMAGLTDPATALKQLEDPGEAGQHFVELLVREENLDLARGRAILAASLAVGPKAVSESFRWNAEVRAQIKLGLLDDARQTASSCQDAHSCIEALLLLSAAYAKAGQAEAAKMTRDEAFELLPRINDPPQADGRAQMLLKTGFLDEAEQELRRLMRKDNLMLPAFSRVAEPLLKARLERGEIATAFELAVDWSVLNDDPEALATLYSLVEKTEAPPPDFSRYLRHMREIR